MKNKMLISALVVVFIFVTSISSLFAIEETTRRTGKGGSGFVIVEESNIIDSNRAGVDDKAIYNYDGDRVGWWVWGKEIKR